MAFGISAATYMAVGAATMAVGAVTGSKDLQMVGGLAMGGAGVAAGMAGGGLATLASGAQLVGGALQVAGTLTENSKLASIGAMINMAGALSSPSSAAGEAASAETAPSIESVAKGESAIGDYGFKTAASSEGVKIGAEKIAQQATSAADSVLEKIKKYDSLINMIGGAANMMNENQQLNDALDQNQSQFNERMTLDRRRSTAVAIPGTLPIAPGNSPVGAVVPNRNIGLLNQTGQRARGIA